MDKKTESAIRDKLRCVATERALAGEHVKLHPDSWRALRHMKGLDVRRVTVDGEVCVWGADLHQFLARIDPATWSADRAVGDA